MWVKCDYSDCEHNRDQECQLNYISLVDGSCTDYKDYMKSNPLYQSPYFKRCRAQINGKAVDYRAQSKGMRYEWMGFVLYTEDDIRHSIANASFTEEVTGLLCGGGDIQTHKDMPDRIRKLQKELKPVLELPWMEIDKKTKALVPHKESIDEMLAPNGVSGDLAP